MKLYKIRVALHWTNSKSYVAGYPDIYVSANDEEEARKKAYTYKEINKKVVDITSFKEISEPFII